MGKQRGIFSVVLILVIVTALLSFLNNAQSIIGKSYTTSQQFEWEIENYYNGLYDYILTPFDAEEAKAQIEVGQDEIEYYRTYYGTLDEQIRNIFDQYTDRLAEENLAADVKKALIEERERKIEDIKKNFDDDTVVEKKIRAIKEGAVDAYAKEVQRGKSEFLSSTFYRHFSYDLTNVDTKEHFANNKSNEKSLFQAQFLLDNGETFPPYKNGPYEQTTYSNGIYGGTATSTTEARMTEFIDIPTDYSNQSYLLTEHYLPIREKAEKFEGTIEVSKSALKDAQFNREYTGFAKYKMISYILWALGIVSAIILYFIRPTKADIAPLFPQVKVLFKKLPIDVAIAIVAISAMMFVDFADRLGQIANVVAYNEFNNHFGNLFDFVVKFGLTILALLVAIIGTVWLLDEVRLKERWQQSAVLRIWHAGQEVFLNRSIGMQTFAMLIVFFLAGVGAAGVLVSGWLILIYAPLFIFVLLPTLYMMLRRMGYLNRVMKQTEDMAEGKLTSDIVVKGKSPIANHAQNLNKLRDGVRVSMTAQAKSERLKTELITNVSHDLRTPLTSIITYTDLLKNPNITTEEREKYIDILDKKSARLKTLIEDLFDVSKMASGNVELTKQRVDLAQLLQQAVAEHEEAFANASLDLRTNIESQPIFAYVDGQKWWRLLDNLIVNAQKYALEGTRVYVSLSERGSEAEFVVKNIAKYELAENVEELTERFKRADTSRHTEGSGLGLAIAQSIADLHGAHMKIEVDGDLFKVIVKVPIAY